MTLEPSPRPPLGLPPGSIRAIMTMLIVAIFWILLLVPDDQAVRIPLNMYFLLSLVMVFFVAHGKSIARKDQPHPSPLWLPGGTLRFLIVAGSIAVVAFVAFQHSERFDRLTPNPDQLRNWKYYYAALGVGFVIGYLLHIMPFKRAWWFEAFQAWVAVIAMAIMFLELVFQVFINVTLPNPIEALAWHTAVTGIVAFYFGSRS
jgi:hypothetical protein